MCRHAVDSSTLDSPNTKTFLLLQAHFSRLPLPCADYLTDLKSVLDQAIRILQVRISMSKHKLIGINTNDDYFCCKAMIDIVADRGWLGAALRIMQILQMIIQARWIDEPALLTLPHLEREHLRLFSSLPKSLPKLCAVTQGNYNRLASALQGELNDVEIKEVMKFGKIAIEFSKINSPLLRV